MSVPNEEKKNCQSSGGRMSPRFEHILSISGGKDSSALYLLALERRERTGKPFRAVFADTGNEHQITYDYVRSLHKETGGPEVEWVRADFCDKFEKKRETIRDVWPTKGVPPEFVASALEHCYPTGNSFLDLCMLRAGFPGPGMYQFCTGELKIKPIEWQIFEPVWVADRTVVSWQGIRRDESRRRKDASLRQRITAQGRKLLSEGRYIAFRPLINWTVEDVWRMHVRHGIEPNRLYRLGFSRVGCMPCIYSGKLDLRAMATNFPEHVDRIEGWEKIVSLVSKAGNATFLSAIDYSGSGPTDHRHGIRARTDWAKTAHGGKQYMLFPIIDERSQLLQDNDTACGEWGVCE